jgi:hypothetical protein
MLITVRGDQFVEPLNKIRPFGRRPTMLISPRSTFVPGRKNWGRPQVHFSVVLSSSRMNRRRYRRWRIRILRADLLVVAVLFGGTVAACNLWPEKAVADIAIAAAALVAYISWRISKR